MGRYSLEELQKLRDSGLSFTKIAKIFGTTRQYIHQLIPGKSEYRSRWTRANNMYIKTKHSAKRRGLIFELTPEDVLVIIESACIYGGKREGIKIGIDRLDNTIGYTKENSAPCCFLHNRIKSDVFSKEELKGIIEKYPKYSQCANWPITTKCISICGPREGQQ